MRGRIVADHQGKIQLIQAFPLHGHADQTARFPGHEVDRLGRRQLSGHDQIAFVLSILVIDNDDEAAGADILDCFTNCAKWHIVLPGQCITSFSRYLARISTSRLTIAPGFRRPEAVFIWVYGISDTPNPPASTAVTVSLAPSLAMKPFSTT